MNEKGKKVGKRMKDFVMEFIIKRENGRTLCIVNISIGTDESQENVGETEKCKYFLIENVDWYKGEWTWSHLCQLQQQGCWADTKCSRKYWIKPELIMFPYNL